VGTTAILGVALLAICAVASQDDPLSPQVDDWPIRDPIVGPVDGEVGSATKQVPPPAPSTVGHGPRRFGGFAPSGHLVSPRLQYILNLSPEQQAQIQALQKQVDDELDDLLTPEQKEQLKRPWVGSARRGRSPSRPIGPPWARRKIESSDSPAQ
jgi:hypothetical protein